MQTYDVRNEADALRVLAALGNTDSADIPIPRFHGWPKIEVTVPDGIGVEGAQAVTTIVRLIQRQYCALKYGTFSLKHLTNSDRAAVKPTVDFGPDKLVIDLSRPATAMAQAARNRASAGDFGRADHDGGLFGARSSDDESWPRTARELGTTALQRLSPAQIARLAYRAIIVAGLSLTCTTLNKDRLSHALDLQKEHTQQQLRLAVLEQTRVATKTGLPVPQAAQREVEKGVEAEDETIRSLVRGDYNGPFQRFIRMADHARPALLQLARSEVIDINGMILSAQQAVGAAKALKRVQAPSWKPVVKPSRSDKA